MFLNFVYISIGFVLLIYGADYLVKGASSLAKRFGISSLVIGLTVVAFGTSAPELAVNLFSAARGATDIAVANILGSNIANILLILGISAAIVPITVQKGTTWKEIPLSLLAAILLVVFGSDIFLDRAAVNSITRAEGLALLSLFVIFLYYTYGISKVQEESKKEETIKIFSVWKLSLFIFGGLAGLVIGGKLIVDNAVQIASALGVSEHLIGLTIVAVGTSLPELATCIVATLKKQPGLVVGNVVGSNIFNILFVLGLTATISPLPFSDRALQDGFWLLGISALLFIAMFVGVKQVFQRWQGVAFVLIYALYLLIAISQK